MTKVEAIRKILEDHNGIATWEIIYSEIEKYYPNIKVSAEWEAGIRGVLYREIKNKKYFKKVGLALYALSDYKEDKFEDIKQDIARMHPYMEGICLEIGNFLKLKTFTADPSAQYNNLPLSELATMQKIPDFTYSPIVEATKKIDVVWFNNKGYQFPKRAIEIVDSIGTLEPALKRTLQLAEFDLSFYILCKNEHVKKVAKEITTEPYIRLKERYIVRDYDHIMKIYKNPIAYTNDDFLKISTKY